MKSTASHVQPSVVVTSRPVQKLDVGLVEPTTRGDRFMSVANYFSRTETHEALLHRDHKKHDQLKPGQERITPPTDRA